MSFKPLRRKIGVITLALACVFAAGWVRSGSQIDLALLSLGNQQSVFFSASGKFRVTCPHKRDIQIDVVTNHEGREFVETLLIGRTSFENTTFRHLSLPGRLVQATYSCPPGEVSDKEVGRILCISYYLIVTPLTLLSAWLLLSNPRVKKIEPIELPTKTEP